MGTSFYDYINRLRIEAAKEQLLREKGVPIIDIALEVGFNNKATFYKAFKKYVRSTPSQFRNGVQPVG